MKEKKYKEVAGKLPTYKEVALDLAKYIADNNHFCPIKESINIQECECWGSEMCAQCILKNRKYLQ